MVILFIVALRFGGLLCIFIFGLYFAEQAHNIGTVLHALIVLEGKLGRYAQVKLARDVGAQVSCGAVKPRFYFFDACFFRAENGKINSELIY